MEPLVNRRVLLRGHAGVTLLELTIVLVILIALAGLVVPLVSRSSTDARQTATQASFAVLRDIIMTRYWVDMDQRLQDSGGNPIPGLPQPAGYEVAAYGRPDHPQLRYLFVAPEFAAGQFVTYDPALFRGWNGPYVQAATGVYAVDAVRGFTARYGLDGDPAMIDSYGRPIVLQVPDADNSGTLDATEYEYARLVSAGSDETLSTPADQLMPPLADRGDDLVLFLRVTDTAN